MQTTVEEALWFSARLRFTKEVNNDTVEAFISEVSQAALFLSSHATPPIMHLEMHDQQDSNQRASTFGLRSPSDEKDLHNST